MNLSPDDPILILQEGENVNNSKSIVFTHRNLINTAVIFGKLIDINQGDRVMIPHFQNSYLGSILGNFSALINSAMLVYPSEIFNAKETLISTSNEKCTHIIATEVEYRQMLDQTEFQNLDFSSLKSAVIDSSASNEIIQEIERRFQTKVYKINGLLETAGIITVNDKIIPNTECKIVREKDGKILYPETHGYLKVRGPTVSTQIYNDIGIMNNKIDEDGWLSTEKIASILSNGILKIE